MSLHAEALPPEQQRVLSQVGPVANELGYYLAGGTAVAVHLGHRRSVDLDWFTGGSLDDPLALATQIREADVPLEVQGVDRGTLHARAADVRLSFLEMDYRLLKPVVEWPEFGCCLASLDDLAAMKILAIEQRGLKKDFLDVFAIGVHGIPLSRMLELYQSKFSVKDVARAMYSLCYFDDADSNPSPRLLVDVSWQEVKATIRSWVKSLAE